MTSERKREREKNTYIVFCKMIFFCLRKECYRRKICSWKVYLIVIYLSINIGHLVFHPSIFDERLNIRHINIFHIKNMIVLIHFHIENVYRYGGKNFHFKRFQSTKNHDDFFSASRLQLTTKMASEHKPGGHKLWHAMYMARE